jgi:hypothetical protein
MTGTYSSCSNLTTAVCGPNVTNMYKTYSYCNNISNMYIYSKNVNVTCCLYGRTSDSPRVNIYMPANTYNSDKLINLINTNTNISYDTIDNGGIYNSTYNIYVYDLAE